LERSIYFIFKRKIRASGLKYRLTTRQGEAAQVISEIGQQANSDLIVLGTVERHESTVYYQPETLSNLVRQLPCSLFLVKHYNVADEDCPTVVIGSPR
jgi:nucleotide-binding universal stress UspA family protein